MSSAVAAAAAKSLQSCLTLCDPIDSSLPGSFIPGILQARTLEWVAISFSNAWKWKVKVRPLSRVRFFATPWTAAHQAPLSMGFSSQEYWSGVPVPSPKMSSIPSLILSLTVLRKMVDIYFSFLLTLPSLLTLHLLDMFWSGWNRQRIKWREEMEAFIEYDWPCTLGSWIRFISSLVDTFLVLWSFHHQRLYLHCYLDPERNILFQMENLYGSHVNLQLPTAGFLHLLMDSSQDSHMPGLSLCLCISVSLSLYVCVLLSVSPCSAP